MDRLTQAEFEAQIAGDHTEHANALSVLQITPDVDEDAVWVAIRDGKLERARDLHARLSEHLRRFLHLDPKRGRPHVDRRAHLCIEEEDDHTDAGYANIYRAIKSLSPVLEDARFVIYDSNDRWFDEYGIIGGTLHFERGFAATVDTEPADYWEVEARDRTDDTVLRRFAAGLLAGRAAGSIDDLIRRYLLAGKDLPTDEAEATRSQLERAVALDPDDRFIWLHRGNLQVATDEYAAAQNSFLRAMANGERRWAPLELAALALKQSDFEQAADHLVTVIEQAPDLTIARLLLGYLLYRRGDLASAQKQWRQVRIKYEGNPGLRCQRTYLYRTGCYIDVLTAFATYAHPDRPLAEELCKLGEYYRLRAARNEDEESLSLARNLYERAHAINPEQTDALGRLGSFARDAGDLDHALALLSQYDEHATRNNSRRWYHDHTFLSALIERGNQLLEVAVSSPPPGDASVYAQADKLFERANTVAEGKEIGPLVGRSSAVAGLGDYRRALAFVDQALALNDRSVHALGNRAACLNNLGRYDEARRAGELAIGLDDSYYHGHYIVGCTLAETGGDKADILAALRRAIDCYPPCRRHAAADPSFEHLRDDPEFLAVIDEP